jgi:diamine N-acetyltransferase
MAEDSVVIRPATTSDLPFVMTTERLPRFEQFIGCWSEQEHRAALARPATAYFLGFKTSARPEGFAMVLDVGDPHGNVFLMRIAVRTPNRGFGTPFLRSVISWVFDQPASHRFWLDVLDNNARARHVYRNVGFVEEGVMREAWRFPTGTRRNLVLMSITRSEWLKKKG